MTPAARALDNDGRVAYIAGLSATVSSGEPPGVVVADASFIERLRRARHGQGTLPSVVMQRARSEEHTSELPSLMRLSYAVFCLKTKKHQTTIYSTSLYSIL